MEPLLGLFVIIAFIATPIEMEKKTQRDIERKEKALKEDVENGEQPE